MTMDELKNALDRAKVDPEAYSLRGGMGWYDRYCIEQIGKRWRVYFAERGERQDEKEFATESEACEYLYNWILSDPTTRKETGGCHKVTS